ncbi:hypothetical protein I2I05_11810 [Hymenobacter sp. BT683]|uniref:Uncharacterized protein n=1 Tax=Hymenobacter jeongseonensis TaxID=2791027 RepID=A0ABS0IIB8_9BACT|nr:hypothetical protein [Hymenobacter jeongseonensis]MBF9238081.1 hypothetical protein [Hymenobacter jeongseonensis]
MFQNVLVAGCCLLLTASCATGDGAGGEYRSTALVSSTGDTAYVKSYRWGLTGDKQLSTIAGTDEPIGLADRGKPGLVEGLDPFQYRLAHDTLTLYARAPLPAFALRCPSLVVEYRLVDNAQYMALYEPLGNSAFHRVPE